VEDNLSRSAFVGRVKRELGVRDVRSRLVIAAVGDESLHEAWATSRSARSFDIVLVYYGEDGRWFRARGDAWLEMRGPKFELIRRALSHVQLDSYRYFFFPDDDLAMTVHQIEELFDLTERFELDLAQPALDEASYVSHEITRVRRDSVLRFTNFVEVMCPVFSRGGLERCRDSFGLSGSNWGLDAVWAQLLTKARARIGILDAVAMTHVRPPRADYSWCSSDPEGDLEQLCMRFGVDLQPRVESVVKHMGLEACGLSDVGTSNLERDRVQRHTTAEEGAVEASEQLLESTEGGSTLVPQGRARVLPYLWTRAGGESSEAELRGSEVEGTAADESEDERVRRDLDPVGRWTSPDSERALVRGDEQMGANPRGAGWETDFGCRSIFLQRLRAVARGMRRRQPSKALGCGIGVWVANPGRIAAAWSLVRQLRKQDHVLPIEVWIHTSRSVGGRLRQLFGKHDATIHVVERTERSEGWHAEGQQLAVLRDSHFECLILVSAECDRPPDLDWLARQSRAPAVLRRGLNEYGRTREVYLVAGLRAGTMSESDPRFLVVHRKRSWAAILLANWLAENGAILKPYVTSALELFQIAAMHARVRVELTAPRAWDWVVAQGGATCGGEPHASALSYEEESHRGELAREWSGWIGEPARPSNALVSWFRGFTEQDLIWTASGGIPFRLRLLPDGRVGAGCNGGARFWYLDDASAGPKLVLRGATDAAITLQYDQAGGWIGEAPAGGVLELATMETWSGWLLETGDPGSGSHDEGRSGSPPRAASIEESARFLMELTDPHGLLDWRRAVCVGARRHAPCSVCGKRWPERTAAIVECPTGRGVEEEELASMKHCRLALRRLLPLDLVVFHMGPRDAVAGGVLTNAGDWIEQARAVVVVGVDTSSEARVAVRRFAVRYSRRVRRFFTWPGVALVEMRQEGRS
jgi:hypothetical protein